MLTDARHHQITTSSEQAANNLSSAIESFLRKRSDARQHLQSALQEDPQCTLSNALQGLMYAGLRKSAVSDMIRQSLDLARQGVDKATPRERGYVTALEHCLAGQPELAVRCYEQILQEHPTDLLALSLAQGELFWLGQMPYAEKLSARVSPHWSAELQGYPDYLAIRSFDLEEVGEFAQAESFGRESVAIRADNIWGTHAVAHILLMQNRVNEGLCWLDDLSEHWVDANQLKFHLWWHQCLFHLEDDNHSAVLAIYDQWLRNPEQPLMQALPDFYLDLQNGASMLWRLETAGVDVGDRWQEMAEAVMPGYRDMTSPFTSAHIAIILQAAERFGEFDVLLDCMQVFIANNDNALSRGYACALAAAKACRSHRQGNHAEVLETLLPNQATLSQMGGSHAQQEVFYQMMFDSARRLGRDQDMRFLRRELERHGFQALTQRIAYSDLQGSD